MKESQVNKVLIYLSDIYPNFSFPEETERSTKRKVQSWSSFLGDYNKKTVFQAIKELSRENPDFPPSAPRLEKTCNEIRKQQQQQKRKKRKQLSEEDREEIQKTIDQVLTENPDLYGDELTRVEEVLTEGNTK